MKATWIDKTLDKIDSFEKLEQNWDSHDGEPISSRTREYAKQWITSVYTEDMERPSVCPCPNNSIQFEWHTCDEDKDSDIDLEVIVYNTGSLEVDHHKHFWCPSQMSSTNRILTLIPLI